MLLLRTTSYITNTISLENMCDVGMIRKTGFTTFVKCWVLIFDHINAFYPFRRQSDAHYGVLVAVYTKNFILFYIIKKIYKNIYNSKNIKIRDII